MRVEFYGCLWEGLYGIHDPSIFLLSLSLSVFLSLSLSFSLSLSPSPSPSPPLSLSLSLSLPPSLSHKVFKVFSLTSVNEYFSLSDNVSKAQSVNLVSVNQRYEMLKVINICTYPIMHLYWRPIYENCAFLLKSRSVNWKFYFAQSVTELKYLYIGLRSRWIMKS